MNREQADRILIELWLEKAADALAWSKFYQKLFADRQESDYIPTATFEPADIAQRLEQAESFVAVIHDLIDTKNP